MIVLPATQSPFSILIIAYAVKLSSPDVGSSRKSIEGLVISYTPTAVRFRSPPEIPLLQSFLKSSLF